MDIKNEFPVNTRVMAMSKTCINYKRIGKVVGYTINNNYIKVYFRGTGMTTNLSPKSVVALQ